MIYSRFSQMKRDLVYYRLLFFKNEDERSRRRNTLYQKYPIINFEKYLKECQRIWLEYMEQKLEATAMKKNPIGKFLSKYPLPLKEMMVLIDLVEHTIAFNSFMEEQDKESLFQKFNVRYNSSMLKKHKLVFLIPDPIRPLNKEYVVSYKAQLLLHGKKYTEAYEQLDMVLEEESNRNHPDDIQTLFYVEKPKKMLADLIVSEETMRQLMAALSRVEKNDIILNEWGISSVAEYGMGVTLNFRGPSGTGKTLAAHAIANKLHKKLLVVRYDQLQSKWVGETEKNVQRAFKLAKMKDSILFFDEADAVAHDRSTLERSWEISQVNTLLKELERFEGVCIFATNFTEKLDPAFQRRLTMHVDFQIPTAAMSRKILDRLLPRKARGKVDISRLQLDGLPGGLLKNVVLNASGFAARDCSGKIEQVHLEEAVRSVKVNEVKENISYII